MKKYVKIESNKIVALTNDITGSGTWLELQGTGDTLHVVDPELNIADIIHFPTINYTGSFVWSNDELSWVTASIE